MGIVNVPPRDRLAGCLLGGAIGDALGYPVEFTRPGARVHAQLGGRAPAELPRGPLDAAMVSDDTQMTLFAAEGLVDAFSEAAAPTAETIVATARAAWLRWLLTQTRFGPAGLGADEQAGGLLADRRLFARRAPGTTCLTALERLRADPAARPSPTAPPNDSKGCGAVMRAAPYGLVAPDRATAFAWARDTGVLTHGHPSGYLSAAALAAIVCDLARGRTLESALDGALALLDASGPPAAETVAALRAARVVARRGAPTPEALEGLGGGWVGEEALAIALVCVITADPSHPDGVADALFRAVAHGGDSDSTGAIAGNLLGVMVGVEGLPSAWVESVELRDVADRLAGALWTVVGGA